MADNCILGLPEMDAQHAYLYGLFDRLIAPQSAEERAALLAEIEGMLDFHFTCEEHLIRHYQLPGFAAHQADHQQAAEAFLARQEAFSRQQGNPARLRATLTGWLREHCQSVDTQYAQEILARRQAANWHPRGPAPGDAQKNDALAS